MDKELEEQIAKDNPEEAKTAEPVKRPVMDVKPRGESPAPATRSADAKPADAQSAKPAEPASQPVEPPPEPAPPEDDKAEHTKKEEPAKPKSPKQPHTPGIGLAITATVIIVLGIAALTVFAYLQSQ